MKTKQFNVVTDRYFSYSIIREDKFSIVVYYKSPDMWIDNEKEHSRLPSYWCAI